MADQKKMMLKIPLAYYRELEVIAQKNIIGTEQLAEMVVLTFVDNMREALYPIIANLHKKEEGNAEVPVEK